MHFSSNSSNQSDQSSLPTKIAKLEARMVGKTSSAVAAPAQVQKQVQSTLWSAAVKFGSPPDSLPPESLVSNDDSDDDNGGEFLIQATTQKRRKVEDSALFEHIEAAADARQVNKESDSNKVGPDVNKKRRGRGRGSSASGKGHGSRVCDQTKMETVSLSIGQLEISRKMQESFSNEHLGLDGCTSSEVTSLRAKVAALEEELTKSREENSDRRYQCQHDHFLFQCKIVLSYLFNFEPELKDLKDYEQQMKPIRWGGGDFQFVQIQEARMKVCQDSLRLGNVGVVRAGTVISEAWEDGQAFKDINTHLRNLLENKEAVERQRKLLKKRQSDKGDGSDIEAVQDDVLFLDEAYKSHLASIKREEEMVLCDRDRYELEKGGLIQEMKHIRDEDGSCFNNFQILNHRYALLNLLGKGGFSEVYKAFDLVEHRYVACKLHGLDAQWSEDKKQSYIRHALREYNIHKTLVHPHIVRLWDIFEIDPNTFCTVLDYCSGKDLDGVLKATPLLPEREARIIIVQIFQGLVYLNRRSQKIIHYDLKPGNVLFDELGLAKITDFGLSKIVDGDVGSQGMELTSQGAGTYWYLPPECFEINKTPLISSNVGYTVISGRDGVWWFDGVVEKFVG
ncbi:serine threonine- kinase TOUSLED isoform X1 [Olea europaea subsp. europaea]|uniref:Serine threonine- kinase TOUSLED isoform X1 n=1 Tax=Olea europaea subsp. europaea TaxID=158383 RepID=A0A8S0QTJ3_OLEEU|nr:serine threonine- kinase TOUSLED isoform X1 [Olea europaea subsp. europaea]